MGDTTAAYDMEKVIVSAAGGEPFVSKLIPNSEDVGNKIITDLKLSGKVRFLKIHIQHQKDGINIFLVVLKVLL